MDYQTTLDLHQHVLKYFDELVKVKDFYDTTRLVEVVDYFDKKLVVDNIRWDRVSSEPNIFIRINAPKYRGIRLEIFQDRFGFDFNLGSQPNNDTFMFHDIGVLKYMKSKEISASYDNIKLSDYGIPDNPEEWNDDHYIILKMLK